MKSIFSLPASPKSPGRAPAANRVKLPLQISAGALLALAALLFVMGACSRHSDPPPDPLAIHRAALKDAYQGDVDLAAAAPRYQISVNFPPPGDVLTGSLRVDLTNTSPDPWPHLVFRLYPMLDQYGGQMALLSARQRFADQLAYQAKSSAVRVDLHARCCPVRRRRWSFLGS